MRVLVAGASGFIGRHLIDALLTRNHEVVAVARSVSGFKFGYDGVAITKMDLTVPRAPHEWQGVLEGIDVVVNAVGIIAESGSQSFDALHRNFPTMLFQGCVLAGVKRIIQISALGAEVDAVSRYHLSKYAADTFLQSLAIESVIVKPSLVFGARGKSTEFFRALAAQPVQVLIEGGRQLVQPIHISDLVSILVELVSMNRLPSQIAAVGPAPITFREMLEGYRHWLGIDHAGTGRLRSVSIHYSFALLCAKLFSFTKSSYLTAANLQMLQQGNTASAEPSAAILGRQPASFRAVLTKSPATDADRWYARLYFLQPMLRWIIAFIWIYTGIVSAVVYPQTDSYSMLEQVGLSGWMLPVNLYGAAILDIALGIAVLLRYHPFLTGLLQLAVIGAYTLIISIFLPEYWFHPFGPIIKNIPMVMLILIMLATERK